MTGKWDAPGVPHRGWSCTLCYDLEDERQTCQMCERQEIRYVHVMTHPNWPGTLECGCICAGHMESDYARAKAREDGVKADSRKRVRDEKLRRRDPEAYARRMSVAAGAKCLLAAAGDIAAGQLRDHERRFVSDVIARTTRNPAYVLQLSEKQMAWLDALRRRKLQRDTVNARFRATGQPHGQIPPLRRPPEIQQQARQAAAVPEHR